MKRNLFASILASTLLLSHGTPLHADELTIYSGRSKSLVEKLFNDYQTATGDKLNVRYGDTAELAATILEEGPNSPADIFFAQDAGALGALDESSLLDPLPESILSRVPAAVRSKSGTWVGVSGRERVLAFSVDRVANADLPASVFDLADPKWKGRIGWVPTNASFQAFVTGMRVLHGDDRTREWLKAIKANSPKEYAKNGAAVQAVAAGEVDAVLVNHYYLHGIEKSEGRKIAVRNHFFANGDIGALVNVAGVGILKTSRHKPAAIKFVTWLLDAKAQEFFATETYEFPLAAGIPSPEGLEPLSLENAPTVDLNQLRDLRGTLSLLRDAGIVP